MIAAIAKPPSAGPMMRATLNWMEFSATAFGTSSGPTISITNAWRVGTSIALAVPNIAVST